MDFFTVETLWALFSIVMIDLVLSGDNAIVIALASRNLPPHQQNQAIFWGTAGAIIIRVLLTIVVFFLLKIPYLQLIGGVLLLWIAYSLLTEDDQDEQGEKIKAGKTLFAAIQTIVFADLIMGLDNILAIAGAAHNQLILIIIGLAISIPIMIWGSKLILKIMERFPIIIQLGVAIIAWTAGDMVLNDPRVKNWVGASIHYLEWVLPASCVLLVLGAGYIRKMMSVKTN